MSRNTKDDHHAVRERLMLAGLKIFARKGFDGATVRELCDEAGSNLAAINYYFGDKAGFYKAIHHRARELRSRQLEQLLIDQGQQDPWAVLRNHISALLDCAFDNVMFQTAWLYIREMLEFKPEAQDDLNELGEKNREVYEVQVNQLLTNLLGPKAATPENIVLLRYTYLSMSLFLIIQNHIEQQFQQPARFSLRAAKITQEQLGQFIQDTVRRTVLSIEQAAEGAGI